MNFSNPKNHINKFIYDHIEYSLTIKQIFFRVWLTTSNYIFHCWSIKDIPNKSVKQMDFEFSFYSKGDSNTNSFTFCLALSAFSA